MVTRRQALIGVAAAGAAALARGATDAFASAPLYKEQPVTPVNFAMPSGACDSHFHIYGDSKRFPFVNPSGSNPEPASVEEARAVWRFLHIERCVIIQPSAYGTDNSNILNAMGQIGSSARGIAVIDAKTPDAALDQMDRAGIRGVRLTLRDVAVARPLFQEAAQRLTGRKWHIQLQTQLSVVEHLKDDIMASPVPVSIDHFGGAVASLGLHQPGFDVLVDLVRTGKAYVKVTRVHNVSMMAPDYVDAAPFAKALIAANPQRILWGTDWPHVGGPKGYDDGRILNQLAVWAPDPAQRKTICVDNPARLYQF